MYRRLSALREQLRAAETRLDVQHGDWQARPRPAAAGWGSWGSWGWSLRWVFCLGVVLLGGPRLGCASRSRGLQGECRRLQQLESAKLKRQVTPVT